MNFATSIFVINQACRMVVAEYDPDREQDKRVNYKTLDPSISKGDLVIVPTNTRHKFTVVKIIDVDIPVDFDQPGDIKWVVGKVDTTLHMKLLEDEGIAIKTLQGAEQRRRAKEMLSLVAGDNQDMVKGLALYDDGKPVQTGAPAAAPAGGGSGGKGGGFITIDAEPL